MRDDTILLKHNQHCAYCGEEIRKRYEDREPYWECDCKDAIKNREIDSQIIELNRSRPQPKYFVESTEKIVKIK